MSQAPEKIFGGGQTIDSEGQPTGAYEPAFADWFELQGEREEEARIGLAS